MDPFIGQISIFAGSFAPQGYAFCNGQTLSIAQNQALFSLLGVTYGGNGQTTFQLPNLQSRVPIHFGNGAGLSSQSLGQTGGEENHTLTSAEIASHNHTLSGLDTATTTIPSASSQLGNGTDYPGYLAGTANVTMNGAGISANTGGGARTPTSSPSSR